MDNQRNNPIVPERDDNLGRSSNGSQSEPYKSRESVKSAENLSSTWKLIAAVALLGMLTISWFGWQQYQQFIELQQRFEVLDSRLNNTDESVNQSGVAMQVNISKHSEQLKKHWSEIKKLWGIANDKNKEKIATNTKDISFLASKRVELESSVKKLRAQANKDRAAAESVGENFFGLSADIDKLSESLNDYFQVVQRLERSLEQQNKKIQSNNEAVKSMDAFRRQVNQKLLNLDKKAETQSVQGQATDQQSDTNTLSPQ
jgi:chromosome segregation ATPase